MKIVSLNLAGRKDGIEDRITKIATFLDGERADIICLQEVTFGQSQNLAARINNLMRNQYRYIAADLAEQFTNKHGEPKTDGLAILANEEITKHETLTLKKVPTDERGRPDFHKRIIQLVELQNGLKIANLHLASNQNSYMQLREALREVPPGYLLIGDFNMHRPTMLEEKPCWGSSYQCSVEFTDYVSFPSEDATFDYLLLPKAFTFAKVTAAPGLSDHCAMIYEFG